MAREYRKSKFRGESRRLLVEGLVSLYSGLGETNSDKKSVKPVWVSLEAPPGWGKTRVGLQFYEHLAKEEQGETAYWPAEIDTTLGRKRTYPTDFIRPEKSLPKYLWLGFTCSHRQKNPTKAWEQDIKQLECHLVYVAAKSRELTGLPKRALRAIRSKQKNLAEMGFDELLPIAIGALVDTFPGIGALKKITTSGSKVAYERIKDNRKIARETRLTIPTDCTEVERVVKYLTTISKDGLRIVILVEDIHLADEMLFDFIDGLMQQGGRVLIISTVWPENIMDTSRLTELFDKHADNLHHVTHVQSAPVPPFPDDAGLMELERDARKQILEEYYDQVDETTASMLLDRYINPLMLETFCQLPNLLDRFRGQKLILTADEIEDLPKRLEALYELLWQQMSLADQATLAVAWFVSPENINPVEAPGVREWSHSTLRDVMASLTLYTADDQHEIVAALDANKRPGAWIRAVDEYLRAYMEPLQRQIIGKNGERWLHEELLAGDVRDEILKALAACLTRTADGETPSTKDARVARARAILALYRETYITIKEHRFVGEAIDTLLGDLADTSRDFGERDRLWNVYLGLNSDQVSDRVHFAIRRKRAEKLTEDHLSGAAIEMYSRLVEDMSRAEGFGPRHPDTLAVRYEILLHQSDFGGYERSVLIELANDMLEVFGDSDNPDSLDVKLRLFFLDSDIESYRATLDTLLKKTGAIDKIVANAMNGLVGLLWRLGNHEGAIEECEKLLPRVEMALGKAHHVVFHMRSQRADLLGILDKHPDAVEAFRLLVNDQERELKSEHPDVLRARVDYARSLIEADRPEDALDECNAVVSDAERILGMDHPTYRWAETSRIDVMFSLDQDDEAADASERLFLRAMESPGADDNKGMHARNWHMHNLLRAGRHERAITIQEGAMELESRNFGWNHPRLYVMRHEYVELLNDAGHHEKALTESTELLKDARRQSDYAGAQDRLEPWIMKMVSEQYNRLEATE